MLSVAWSPAYQPEWDEAPQSYVDEGVVGWGRSRRLGMYVEEELALKAYVGVQHYDPARWGVAGEARARFFVSLFVSGRTIALHTYATMDEALGALDAFRARRG
jgi:hypothetical protein